MLKRILPVTALVVSICSADTLVTRSGRRVEGTYLGGTARQVRVDTGSGVETFNVADISEIRFESPEPSASNAAPPPAAPRQEPRERVQLTKPDRPLGSDANGESAAPARRAANGSVQEIPGGTNLVVRMIDDVDSERDNPGQTFRASVDEPVQVNGETIIPRGADAVIKLVEDKQSGKLTGKTELTLAMDSVTVNGKPLVVSSETVSQASESRTGQTAKVAGGGAALGAIIGAIAGGGKGAAIGALGGAAAGGAVQVLTKGQRVRIPSETRLTFTLQQPTHL